MYAVWLRVSARTPWKWCYECHWATEATFFVSSLVFDTSKPMQMIWGVEGESTQENMCWKTVATWLLVIIILLLFPTLRPQVFNTIRKSDIHVQKDALAGFCSFAVLRGLRQFVIQLSQNGLPVQPPLSTTVPSTWKKKQSKPKLSAPRRTLSLGNLETGIRKGHPERFIQKAGIFSQVFL